MNFASDNVMGASAPVLEALRRANEGAQTSYGGDALTKRIEERFCEVFERAVDVFLVATGTAANALALVRLSCTPAAMTWKAGVDLLSFGATKNGCLAAEAIVVFDPALAETLAYRRKRGGHLLSKGRFLAAQFEGYFQGDHWLDNARHANAMAQRLAAGLTALPGVRLAWPCEANEVFPIIPRALDAALRRSGAAYHPWASSSHGETIGADEVLVRLVTSFATSPGDVDRLLDVARGALRSHAAE
jgi:threonine aldolase